MKCAVESCSEPRVDDDVLCSHHLAMRQTWERSMKALAEEFERQHGCPPSDVKP